MKKICCLANAAAAMIICVLASTANGRELSGTVLLPAGQPAAGANVRLFYFHCVTGYGSRNLASTETDADGRFSLAIPEFQRPTIIPFIGPEPLAPKLFLIAEKELYGAVFEEAIESRDRNYTLILAESILVMVRTIDANTRPLTGARVWLNPGSGQLPIHREIWNSLSDEQGNVWFEIPDGMSGFFEGAHDNRRAQANFSVRQMWNSQTPTFTMRIQNDRRLIRGRVTLGDGKTPGAGMILTYGIQSSPRILINEAFQRGESTFAIADEEGRFEISFFLSRQDEARVEAEGLFLFARDPSDDPVYAEAFLQLPPNWVELDDIEINMKAGSPAFGVVRNRLTGAPLPHSIISASPADENPNSPIYFHRLADDRGSFRFRMESREALFGVAQPTAGFVLLAGNESTIGRRLNEATRIDLDASVAPISRGLFRVTYPDGHPAAGESVTIRQAHLNYQARIRTDEGGVAMAQGLAVGEETLVRVEVRNIYLALKHFPQLPDNQEPIDISLQKLRTGEARFIDQNGLPIERGMAYIQIMSEDGGKGLESATFPIHDGQGRFHGLIPNVPFNIRGSAHQQHVAIDGQRDGIEWIIDDDDDKPTVTLHFRRIERINLIHDPDRIVRPAAKPSEEDFLQEMRILGQNTRRFEDAADGNITWFADNNGRFIAMIDADSRKTNRFERLFGFERLIVNGMAFTEDRVWIGTNMGLLAWNRQNMFWSRFAVGGVLVETHVRELSVRDGRLLHITIGRDDENRRRFEYDIEAGAWQEL